MLTAEQFAKKAGCTAQTVRNWCRKGLLYGAEKQWSRNGEIYMIPDDTPIPSVKTGRPFAGSVVFASAKRLIPRPGEPMNTREQYAFLKKHAGCLSYSELSRATGLSIPQLRTMYDLLHERYGI